jgi:dolichol-phosphate mannosyltransferase
MIDQLVPTARYKDTGRVRRIFIIGRGPEDEEPLSHDEAMATLLANTEDAYGFPPFSIMERAITLRSRNLRKGKKQDISLLRGRERAILSDFLSNMSVPRLTSPNFGWADVIPERVLQPAALGASEDPRSGGWGGQSADAINGSAAVSAEKTVGSSEHEVDDPSDVSSPAA